MITQVPELYDGGFWYVVESQPHPEEGGRTPGDIPSGWCAWYRNVNGIECVAVRMPEQVAIPIGPAVSVGEVVGDWPVKPYGRIGGR